MPWLKAKHELLNKALAARRGGKSLLRQFRECLALGAAPNRLSPSEYYDFGLYDDSRHNDRSRAQFLGWRSPVSERLNERIWHALANDKLAFYGLMKGAGLPIPENYAIFHPAGRYFGAVPVFTDPAALAEFLRRDCPYPFFGKPVQGVFGINDILALAYDPETDSLRLKSGESRPLRQYTEALDNPGGLGYLVQQALAPSDAYAALVGPRLSTLRVIVALTPTGARVQRCEWKIPAGDAMVDNYNSGANGNLLAWVDENDGRVRRILAGGFGPEARELDCHPDTGAPLLGIPLPRFQELCELALTASRTMPGLRLQGWDVADTASGPMALEVNLVTPGGIYAVQRVSGRGFYQADIQTLYKSL